MRVKRDCTTSWFVKEKNCGGNKVSRSSKRKTDISEFLLPFLSQNTGINQESFPLPYISLSFLLLNNVVRGIYTCMLQMGMEVRHSGKTARDRGMTKTWEGAVGAWGLQLALEPNYQHRKQCLLLQATQGKRTTRNARAKLSKQSRRMRKTNI